MKRKKKNQKLDLSNLNELAHNPFAQLGETFGIKPSPKDREIPEPVVQPTDQPKLLIRVEKRKGQKKVTAVYHLQNDLETTLKTLKKRFATGGGIQEDAIVLQGDHLQDVVAWFKKEGFSVRGG